MLICTGDRDAFQLVNDWVTVLYPSRRLRADPVHSRRRWWSYGLTPRQYRDFAALRGDPSDNLPGDPGRGTRRPRPSG